MFILKGTLLSVNHLRKGKFIGYAKEDFDSEKEVFYPILLAGKIVRGLNNDWENGDEVPCRNTLCKISII